MHVGAEFVLSVPVAGMEDVVLKIGSCNGAKGDKLKKLEVYNIHTRASRVLKNETAKGV